MLTITDKGLSSIRDAEAGGFLLNAVRFQLSETALTSTDTSAEALTGAVAFDGAISAIEAVGMSSVKLTCKVPVNFPTDGSMKTFRQIGIFLDDGTMFAYGALIPEYDKEAGFGIKAYVLITASRLAAVLNLTISEANSLAVIPHVHMLPDPINAETNAVIVLDEQDDVNEGGTSSSIAIKNGGALNRWAFMGFNKVYHGPIDFLDLKSFHIDEKTHGFWLNNNETVIVVVTSGTGNVYSRKMTYNKNTGVFDVLDKPFNKLDASSVIEIWRNTGNQLPERREDIPDYYMLKHATKATSVTSGAGTGSYYELAHSSGTLSGGSFSFAALAGVPSSRVFVYVDGKELSTTDYTLAGVTVTASGSNIDVYALVEKAPPNPLVGYYLGKYESTVVADGYTTRFFASIVPQDANWIMVFVDGQFIHSSGYTVEPTGVLLNDMPAANSQVQVVCLANYESDELNTNVLHYSMKATELTSVVEIAGMQVSNKQNVFVFVNRKYVKNNDFHLEDNTHISFASAAKPGEMIDVYLFNKMERTADVVTGLDTGPVWDDPAGTMGEPNKIVPRFVSYWGDGTTSSFNVPQVSSGLNLIVFVDGVGQPPSTFTYDYGASKLILSTAVPLNQPIDIIALQEEPDTGKEYKCVSIIQYPTAGAPIASIVVPAGVIPESVCLFYDSAYMHRDGGWTYNAATRTITFSAPLVDKDLELWGITELNHPGWRTGIVFDYGTLKAANTLSKDPHYEPNILLFAGGSYQLHTTYSYVPSNGGQPASVSFAPDDVVEVPYYTLSLVSSNPPTRLMLRSEMSNYYNRGEVDALLTGLKTEVTNNDYITQAQADDLFLTQAEGDARYELKGQGLANNIWNGLITWDSSQLRLVHGLNIDSVARIDVGKWRVVLRNPQNLNVAPTANAFYSNNVNTGSDSGPALIGVMVEVQSTTVFVLHCICMSAGGSGSSQVGKYMDPRRVTFNASGNSTQITVPALSMTKPGVVPGPNGPYNYTQFLPPGGSRVNASNLTFQYGATGGTPSVGLGDYSWSVTSSSDSDIISIDSSGKLFINGDRNRWIDITVSLTDGQTTVTDQIRVNMWW